MTLKTLISGMMILLMPVVSGAQQRKVSSSRHAKAKIPSWAHSHHYKNDKYVYFPDYYTFYSPERGYVFWNNSNWINSESLPSIMPVNDMNNVRIQTLDVPLYIYPEQRIREYANDYPAQPVNGAVVPIPLMH